MTTRTLPKILFYACPRCDGDLFLDVEEEAYVCLQCGRGVLPRAAQPLTVAERTATGDRDAPERDLVAA